MKNESKVTERPEESPRHDFFKKRLRELGVYEKNSDYGGLIGKWVEELSATFGKQGQSGQSAEITVALFNKLMDEWMGKSPKETPHVVTSPDTSRCKRDEGSTEELCDTQP